MTNQKFIQKSEKYSFLFKELVMILMKSRNDSAHVGRLEYVNIDYVLDNEEYNNIDKEILGLFDKGWIYTLLFFWKTGYYKVQRKRNKTLQQTREWITKYYRLFHSIKQHGYNPDLEKSITLPWLFLTKNISLRLDGHHRAGILRFLNYKEVPVLLITPKDFLELNHLNKLLIEELKKLEEPSLVIE